MGCSFKLMVSIKSSSLSGLCCAAEERMKINFFEHVLPISSGRLTLEHEIHISYLYIVFYCYSGLLTADGQHAKDSLLCISQQYWWSDFASYSSMIPLRIMVCKNLRWLSPICRDMFPESPRRGHRRLQQKRVRCQVWPKQKYITLFYQELSVQLQSLSFGTKQLKDIKTDP